MENVEGVGTLIEGENRMRCYNNPFCSSLNPATKAALCKIGLRVHYERRRVLYLNSGANAQLMLLDKGQVITVRQRADGRQKGIEHLCEGDILGLSRLFSEPHEDTTIIVYARTPLEVCLFSTKGFELLCMTCADLARAVISELSRRFLSAINNIEHITLDTSEEKVLYLVQSLASRQAGIQSSKSPLPFTHEELGLLAGINRVTVTRVIDRLKASGILVNAKGAIKLFSTGE